MKEAICFSRVILLWLLSITAAPAVNLQEEATNGSPFRGLYSIDGVTTSNDEYSVWLSWMADRYRIDYPDGLPPFAHPSADGSAVSAAVLSLACRADGRAVGFSGPSPLLVDLVLPMHPEAPDVYSVLNPLYWVLGLLGQEFVRIPVVVTVGGVGVDGEMVRRRGAYNQPRPAVVVEFSGSVVLEYLAAASALSLRVSGDGVDIELSFPVMQVLGVPARQMIEHCGRFPAF